MSDTRLPEGIEGFCDARFGAIPRILAAQLASGAHHGVAVAVRYRGEPVVDVWGGRRETDDGEEPWREETMAVSFSTTKGVTATAAHMALERGGVDIDAPVASVWPEFGKDAVTIRHVLCHEAGVPQIRGEVPDVWALADWEAMVRTMERLEPLWEPGTANGYHALNFGWLVGEIVRRVDGRSLGRFLAEEIAGPLELDGCYIGTPVEEQPRLARLLAPPSGDGPSLSELLGDESITVRALSPEGDIVEFLNSEQGMGCCVPAVSGAFTARSLATVFAALERGGELGGVRLLSRETIERAAEVQNKRPDLVLVAPIYWRLGYMGGGSAVSPIGPNREAFGHKGYGGSVALADPRAEVAVAVVLDKLEMDIYSGERVRDVVNAAVAAAESA